MGNQQILIPLEIKQADRDTLLIRWQDGHESKYPSGYLRELCRCAGCVDEWSGAKRFDPSEIPADIHPLQIQGVGRYGIRVNWSDGHNTGIYTFQYLREICPCAKCAR
ncbi:MAG: hypothetical protein A3C35_02615 [Omnitrophica bacterium RIFCSPHIGHO2_02_FULL_46_11]|nr:MAG: hypothetical protein A3C35_02615 [Omnitrophica bacterium RIFCSPHIGHO2_02_FULL_46_11]OGW87882.1 MAG: hypothetical protein A3A81_05580 [Omnitrophica bacterium RIFCSPLOWO2_01_FULL_45_10b]